MHDPRGDRFHHGAGFRSVKKKFPRLAEWSNIGDIIARPVVIFMTG